MIKVLFVCHGNICRSTMAQFVMEHLVRQSGYENRIQVESAATSNEEIGNGPHPGTVRKMREMGIPMREHRAVRMCRQDYDKYDYIIGMDRWNYQNIMRIIGSDPEQKVSLLLDYSKRKGQEIADPWYTGDFEATYRDVEEGCRSFLEYLTASEP